MNPTDPLEQLHPLREPELIGWWPLAPGWWFLLLLALAACALAGWFLLARYRRNRYRRQGLAQLASIEARYRADDDGSRFFTELNALLKAVALRAYPTRDIASINGEAWRQFLNTSASSGTEFDQNLITAQYQATPPEVDLEQSCRAARHWIKHHEVAQ